MIAASDLESEALYSASLARICGQLSVPGNRLCQQLSSQDRLRDDNRIHGNRGSPSGYTVGYRMIGFMISWVRTAGGKIWRREDCRRDTGNEWIQMMWGNNRPATGQCHRVSVNWQQANATTINRQQADAIGSQSTGSRPTPLPRQSTGDRPMP